LDRDRPPVNHVPARDRPVARDAMKGETVTSDELVRELESRGWRAAVVPAARLGDLRREIESRRTGLDPAYLAVVDRNLELEAPDTTPVARSLIVVAVPHPCARATFTVDGQARAVPIPTTYCHHAEIHAEVAAAIGLALAPAGHWAAPLSLPEKLLAVCAGLARYGRNTIAYVDGWGSFCELVACVSDLAPGADPWTAPRLLERCDTCEACRRACPTGAIDADGLVLRGHRCLTLHNESDPPFPAWIDPAWHHCLWGCLRCQRCCPEDLAMRDEVGEAAGFDERETSLLLGGVDHALLEAERTLREKLGELGLLSYDDDFLGVALSRNLRAALEAR
jgi:epoxyqueuosine reductase